MRLAHSLFFLAFPVFLIAQNRPNLIQYPIPSTISEKVDRLDELLPFQTLLDSLNFGVSRWTDNVVFDSQADDYTKTQQVSSVMAEAFCRAASVVDLGHFVTAETVMAIRNSGNDEASQTIQV